MSLGFIMLSIYLFSIPLCILIFKLGKDASILSLAFVPGLNTGLIFAISMGYIIEFAKQSLISKKLEQWIEK